MLANQAYMELRYVTPLLASKYNVGFVPGEDGTGFLQNVQDQFAACPGRLRLVFTKRESSA